MVSTTGFAQSTFSFLNTPGHARLAALGGVNVSLADRDVNIFTMNPALSGDTLSGLASASYQFYLAEIGQANISYQGRFKQIGALAFNLQHMNYGTLQGYDAAGAPLGEFSAGETALVVGKHFQSDAFRFGANLKTVFSSLAGYNATALALDLGGLFVHPKESFTIGLAIRNLGFTMSNYSSTGSSSLPFDVQVGITFKPEHMPFRFSITAFDLTDFNTIEIEGDKPSAVDQVVRHLNVGAELLLSKNVNVLVAYNFRRRQELQVNELGGGAGLSAGLSVQIKKVELVVSRISYGPQQATYGFTLSTRINTILRKSEKI